ncbi:hypothetical protein BH10ACI2_BH10ACI2_14720 [soil metagenome]
MVPSVNDLPLNKDQAQPTPEKEPTVPFEVLASRLNLPKPDDFPVAKRDMFAGTPAAPKLVGKRSQTYKTVISEGAKAGPNFAGHYSVVTWGAGMGNFSIAIVDATDGRILFMPFDGVGHAGYGLNFEGRDEMNPAFRIDSKLLVFSGCPGKEYEGCTDWDKEGVYIYKFENERFKLLKFVKREDFEAALKN